MRITKKQLKRLIEGVVVSFPSEERFNQMINATKNHMLSMYDEGDPSMQYLGFGAWSAQVEEAIDFIKGMSQGNISKYEEAENEAYYMLGMGHFHPENMNYGVRPR